MENEDQGRLKKTENGAPVCVDDDNEEFSEYSLRLI